jgi:hypothetical protein
MMLAGDDDDADGRAQAGQTGMKTTAKTTTTATAATATTTTTMCSGGRECALAHECTNELEN